MTAPNNSSFWGRIKAPLLAFLKDKIVTASLKKLLKSSAGGFKVWLVTYILEHLYDDIAEPLIKAGLVKLEYTKHKIDGKLTIKKIDEARRSGDAQSYHDAIDDIFN